ncbi:type II secretory pathway, component ExeA (predicted ATPase) [Thioflavicoccus mobilis 8321]|uniref:Type II secretory pathway, component ExeA (Predicted ATPase) n=1 Tax=Thioflavicoccus mobilis 8321 TaxID=765912 RepID=L0GY72_9GAMM|nr:ExeA family protein [Thioflavicoccus mobilis]AGA90772.1 type II secretory pathway, component ExeA (predicted ATPase) [Thioflavicoccus mobilis 8321]
MYLKYFGLKEPSFSIAPDPEYLFLSEQHREALAHLLYGASASGGFVLLTGDVGTGKTTVCRALLEQIPAEVEIALVLNPAMDGPELLRTICEEFHIEVAPQEQSTKRLIDLLNRFLLEAHAKGRRPVLMIDEAQTLGSRELELVRLLTNLETNKHKLLQIFLVGQPELRRLIDSDELRQLSQRITARFHLGPLTARETAAYVRHRLAVAGVDRPLFTRQALERIHALSDGVPRLVNILCDRALLGACVGRDLQVTRGLVERAAKELRGLEAPRHPALRTPRRVFVAALLLALLLAGGWTTWNRVAGGGADDLRHWLVLRLGGEPIPKPTTPPIAAASSHEAPGADEALVPMVAEGEAVAPPAADAVEAAESPPVESAAGLVALGRSEALRALLLRWGVQVADLGTGDPCTRIAAFGLRCQIEEGGTWGNLRFFDRPVLLQLDAGTDAEGFVALGALDGGVATLDLPGGRASQVAVEDLARRWSGLYELLWQPPPTGTILIGPGSSSEDARWLRQLLSQAPGLDFAGGDSGQFDTGLQAALRRFQEGRGLVPDGVAGYRTLIQLHNVVGMPGIPKLIEAN